MKNLLLIAAAAILLASCSTSLDSTSSSPKTDNDTASLYLGYMYGMQMKRIKFNDLNKKELIAGINLGLKGEESDFKIQDMNNFLNQYVNKLALKIADENLVKGKKFLAENAKKSGVKLILPDSIQYKVIKEGKGVIPKETDQVKVHYKGTLISGEEFDSSYKTGQPAEFYLNRVITGWRKALSKMPVGSKWEVFIPSKLAYGQRGAGQQIGPNETLIFEIELLDITTPKEEKKK